MKKASHGAAAYSVDIHDLHGACRMEVGHASFCTKQDAPCVLRRLRRALLDPHASGIECMRVF
jgi:hypothetical protein